MTPRNHSGVSADADARRAIDVPNLADRFCLGSDAEKQQWLFDLPALLNMLGVVVAATRGVAPTSTASSEERNNTENKHV